MLSRYDLYIINCDLYFTLKGKKKEKRYGFPIRVNVTFHLVSPRRWGSTMFFKLANTFLLPRAHFYEKAKRKKKKKKIVTTKKML